MKRVLSALSIGIIAFLGLVVPVAAHAAVPTTVTFAEPVTTAPFASDWVVGIQVAAPGTGVLVSAGDGRVDVVIDGIAGTWASLDVFAGGSAFLSQPLDQPLLPAGDYTLRAIFVPSGSGLTSVTSEPASLTITPLAVDAEVVAALTADAIVVTATLTGDFVESTGSAPAGVWTFALSRPGRDSVIEESRRAQDASALDPVSVTFVSRLAAGTEYTVLWTFMPVDELAGGLELVGEGTTSISTPPASLVTFLATPVAAALPVWIVIAVVLVALLTASIILGLMLRRHRALPHAGDPIPAASEPGGAGNEGPGEPEPST